MLLLLFFFPLLLKDFLFFQLILQALIDQSLKGAGQVFRAFLVIARTLYSFFFSSPVSRLTNVLLSDVIWFLDFFLGEIFSLEGRVV